MQNKSSMEEQYGGSKMLCILISPTDSLQLLNGAVEPFGFAVVSPCSERIEYSCGMACKHIENFVHLWNMCLHGLHEPHGVECKGLLSVCRPDDVPEVFLDSPCTRHLVVGFADCIKLHVLLVRKTRLVRKEEILGLLQVILCLYLSNPSLVNGLVQVLDQMVRVMTNLGIGEHLLGDIDEGLPHVHGNRLNRSSLYGSQALFYQQLGILLSTAFGNINHKASLTVAKYSDIVALTPGFLINTQMVVYLSPAPNTQSILHAAFHDMTYLVGSEAQEAGCPGLALRLKQGVYRFFSSSSVMRSPAAAQGTCTLVYFPSGSLQRGMRALMNVLYCHMSRCLHTRSGRKSYMGKCL